MNDESLIFGVPGGGGLESPDVGPMAQFSLRVAPNDLISLCALQEEFLLLWGSLASKGNLMLVCQIVKLEKD